MGFLAPFLHWALLHSLFKCVVLRVLCSVFTSPIKAAGKLQKEKDSRSLIRSKIGCVGGESVSGWESRIELYRIPYFRTASHRLSENKWQMTPGIWGTPNLYIVEQYNTTRDFVALKSNHYLAGVIHTRTVENYSF